MGSAPRGYFDVDQVGMCYPDPDGDPGRYALKARAAGGSSVVSLRQEPGQSSSPVS